MRILNLSSEAAAKFMRDFNSSMADTAGAEVKLTYEEAQKYLFASRHEKEIPRATHQQFFILFRAFITCPETPANQIVWCFALLGIVADTYEVDALDSDDEVEVGLTWGKHATYFDEPLQRVLSHLSIWQVNQVLTAMVALGVDDDMLCVSNYEERFNQLRLEHSIELFQDWKRSIDDHNVVKDGDMSDARSCCF